MDVDGRGMYGNSCLLDEIVSVKKGSENPPESDGKAEEKAEPSKLQ